MWKRLRHPNIVAFIGVTRNPLQFVSEWMPNGTLTEYLGKDPNADRTRLVSLSSALTVPRLIKVFLELLDVVEGLNFLHANYMTHGDLKGVCIFSLSF